MQVQRWKFFETNTLEIQSAKNLCAAPGQPLLRENKSPRAQPNAMLRAQHAVQQSAGISDPATARHAVFQRMRSALERCIGWRSVLVAFFSLSPLLIGSLVQAAEGERETPLPLPSWATFPEPVTPIAHETLRMHNEFMWIIVILFVVVFAIMVYSMVMHRKRTGAVPATFTGPRGRLQWFWVLVPFALLLFIDFVLMGVPAFRAVLAMEDTFTQADMVLKVTGSQWKWQYEYLGSNGQPDPGIKFLSVLSTPLDERQNRKEKNPNYLLEVDNPVVLPVGKKVRVLLASTDVIHSWWIPAFGVKRDAIPGFLRETWVKIEKPGTYRGQCTELCGREHGFMPVVVQAVSEPEFQHWLVRKREDIAKSAGDPNREWSKEELMTKGKDVYDTVCVSCHQLNGQGLPPAFPPLAHSPVIHTPLFVDGKPPKDGHIDRVMHGKPGTAMQAFVQSLSDVEIAAVITYERNSFGNTQSDFVQPSEIKALRGK